MTEHSGNVRTLLEEIAKSLVDEPSEVSVTRLMAKPRSLS